MPLQINLEIDFNKESIEDAIRKLQSILDVINHEKGEGAVVLESSDEEDEEEKKEEKKEEIPKCYTKNKFGTIDCFCGSNLDLKNFPRHKKTSKHRLWESQQQK